MRGADLLVESLVTAGVKRVFALSGNQIMSIFDASIGTSINLIHTRHEAAAVHMADAWGRINDEPGIALVTAGPGFANALSALYVAKMAESPLILFSGHTPTRQLGMGAFQEMPQAELAGHLCKASWMVKNTNDIYDDVAKAFQIARSGRPGPVHLSLPADLLDAEVSLKDDFSPHANDFVPQSGQISENDIEMISKSLSQSERPLILAGPAMSRNSSREVLELLSKKGFPALGMESPRGTNDPSLGAFTEILFKADLIVLLDKKWDFTLQFGSEEIISTNAKIIQIDSDKDVLNLTSATLGKAQNRLTTISSNPGPFAKSLLESLEYKHSSWSEEVLEAVSYRPVEWKEIESAKGSPVHAVEIGRAIQAFLDKGDDSIYVSDGGEVGQWAQACLSNHTRLTNGPSGSIGSSIPLAIGARASNPKARIVAVLGDGTFGFHPSEFDTAVRNKLPFIAVIGNDSAWNAEYQIQLRDFGSDRLTGCELLPSTRYDQVVEAFGGYGEMVTTESELSDALERAYQKNVPSCINVIMNRNPAPAIHT